MVPGARLRRRERTWSGVLGTIMIILGVLGMIGGLMNLSGGFWLEFSVTAGGGTLTDELRAELVAIKPAMIGLAVSSMVIAGLLLATGILTLRRRPLARPVAIVWSTLKILLAVVSTLIAFAIQDIQIRSGLGGGGPAAMMWITRTMMGGSLILGALWTVALPVFLLIWFNRARIRAEITEWSPPAP
jgi:hypothetical protein